MAKRRGHQEGSIFQRKSDGLWIASITYTDAAGKMHWPRRYHKKRGKPETHYASCNAK